MDPPMDANLSDWSNMISWLHPSVLNKVVCKFLILFYVLLNVVRRTSGHLLPCQRIPVLTSETVITVALTNIHNNNNNNNNNNNFYDLSHPNTPPPAGVGPITVAELTSMQCVFTNASCPSWVSLRRC